MTLKKLESWMNRLLDVGKSSNLINFKDNKSTSAKVLWPEAAALFDSTAAFAVFEPREIPDEIKEDKTESPETSPSVNGEDNVVSGPEVTAPEKIRSAEEIYLEKWQPQIRKNELLLYNVNTPSVKIAGNLLKKQETVIEETGVNVVYMAFGFIEWTESDSSKEKYKAPVLLVPVKLINESAIMPFKVKMTGEDAIVNPTFKYKLLMEYGVTLPEYDDQGFTEYMTMIREVAARLSWTVTDDVRLGVFSFLKLNMYEDLKVNAERIIKNENVLSLMGESGGAATDEPFDPKKGRKEDGRENTEGKNEEAELHNVVDADSSQLEAIKMAKSGRSFVLQGPPGTGKSQTITNIIAEALYDGKKVLFVSEKMAALNVVYDKLKKAGLSDFCMELHSYKANKREFTDELVRTLKLRKSTLSEKAEEEMLIRKEAEEKLDRYAGELHEIRPVINKSLFKVISAYSVNSGAMDVDYVIPRINSRPESHVRTAAGLLSRFAGYVPTIGYDYKENPWYGFISTDLSQGGKRKLKEAFSVLAENTAFQQQTYGFLENVSRLAVELSEKKNGILSEYEEDVFKINGTETGRKLRKLYSNSFTRLFNSDYKSLMQEFRLCRKDGRKLKYEEAIELSDRLSEYADAAGKLSALSEEAGTSADIICREAERLHEPYSVINAAFGSVSSLTLGELSEKASGCLLEFDMAENYQGFRVLLSELTDNGLCDFIEKARNEGVPADALPDAYKKLFWYDWADYILGTEGDTFNAISRISHDSTTELFREKDRLHFEVSRAQIRAKLSSGRPDTDLISQGSDIAKLLREGEKKRRLKSIRTMLSEMSMLIQQLKPCFLMSPLSVSTYLGASGMEFDMVVFDEASQIFPQDAVGAIYRGKQVVVVGDSRQMPPSNFFTAELSGEDKDEEMGDVSDFESILDLCSASFPQIRLKWHYRSRHESLIAFSNNYFYDNELVTFPSAAADKKWEGVDFYHVDGVFDHHSGSNRIEAEKIVDLIYENFERFPERSLGVVAFSIRQQGLIETLLYKRRRENPEFEAFFAKDKSEPFFIKNLETVQGDERDTVIFSVGYGPDREGRIIYNFGPLNNEGGERRLNVAVTRAKINVQLVTSMHYTDIDLKRTSAKGAKLLRAYLEYAEMGPDSLEREYRVSDADEFDSGFEMEVCSFLREKGYTVDTQVGCSIYRIDLGLKRGEGSDYVLAIECDGASYHSSDTARDRDRLRQQVLEQMGWKFYRIWSVDWFRNRKLEEQWLIEACEKALMDGFDDGKGSDGGNNGETTCDDGNSGGSEVTRMAEPLEDFEDEAEESHFEFPEYKLSDDAAIIGDSRKGRLGKILEVVKNEAPVSEEWLLKRMCCLYGREKVTSYVTETFGREMARPEDYGYVRRKGFIYVKDNHRYILRVPSESFRRELKYICNEELAAGMLFFIKKNISVEKEGLYQTMAKILGYKRLTDDMEERFDEALFLLRTLVTDNDGMLSLAKRD